MIRQVCCHTCKYGDWVVVNPPCKRCIGFSKWRKRVKPIRTQPVYPAGKVRRV